MSLALSQRRVVRFLEILAVWGVAIVQPILGVLGGASDYFIVFGIGSSGVVWFVLGLVLIVPVVSILVEIVVWRFARVRDLFHFCAIGSCITLALAQLWKVSFGLAGGLYLALTTATGIMLVASYVRWRTVREWVSWLAVVPLIASSLFFFSTASGRYARAQTLAAEKNPSIAAPVVVLIFDEFPLSSLLNGSGDIDANRYPNFSRLKSLSTWYRQYSTTAEVTQFAVPSMLSGVDPKRGLGGIYADHPKTLFSLVASSHTMNVDEAVTDLCPPSFCPAKDGESISSDWIGFMRGLRVVMRQRIDTTARNEMNIFEGFVPQTGADKLGAALADGPIPFSDLPTTGVSNLVAAFETGRFDAWLKTLTDSAKPSFNYLHLILPHQPWVYLPDKTMYGTTEAEYLNTETAWETKVKEQRHLLQVQYVDTMIGRFLDTLENSGILDKALVIVAADHGASFRAGYSRRFATKDLANATDLMRSPLFIKYPNQTSGQVNDDNVENIDVLPILAEKLGFSVPWKMDGLLPKDKSGSRATTKTLYFVYDPYGAPKRKVDRLEIDFETYRNETMSVGFVGSREESRALDHLYGSTPYESLRGRRIDSFAVRPGGLRLTIDDDVKPAKRRVLVRGDVSGAVAAGDWFAVAVNGEIVGLSPVVSRDGKQRMMSLAYPVADSATVEVFRIITRSTLERVAVS